MSRGLSAFTPQCRALLRYVEERGPIPWTELRSRARFGKYALNHLRLLEERGFVRRNHDGVVEAIDARA